MNGFDATSVAIVVIAVTIDALWGEVPSRIHPVVGIGTLTRYLLRAAPARPYAQLGFGFGVVLVVLGAAAGATLLSCLLLDQLVSDLVALPAWLVGGVRVTLEGLLLSTLFAIRGLIQAGMRMRQALKTSVGDGRLALSHLCSRDPALLNEAELCAATVESLSENTSDSFVAPLFWYVLVASCGGCGLCGAAVYRALNTLDAMIGYHGKYEYLGKTAARLDDVLNFIPARLTALLLVLAAVVGPRAFNAKQSARVAWRDHGLTQSPNAGWPMAAAAGALSVELAKREYYTLGSGLAKPNVQSIAACERLVAVTAALWLGVVAACGLG